MIISVCGGDSRMAELANLAAEQGHDVRVMGFDSACFLKEKARLCPTAAECFHSADWIILPLPISLDQMHLFAPFAQDAILLSDLFSEMRPSQLLFGGKISPSVSASAEHLGLTLFDYLCREEFAVANALPTAEGAIQIAMEQLRCTLSATECLVLGYGRVGMVLAHLLKGIGAEVSVSCRNKGALALANAMGNHTFPLCDLKKHLNRYPLLFNTIPAGILNKEVLRSASTESLFIELASPPGGMDQAYCRKIGLKVIHAQGLPGKVAPITGGKIILETVASIASEQMPFQKEG